MIAPARTAACRALDAIDARRRDLPHALAELKGVATDSRDAALATEIVTGTLRWQGRIDARLTAAATRSLDELPRVVLCVLRSAAYQLEFLDRVPPHAVVHDAVALVRAVGHPRLAGFANAILRRMADPRRAPPPPEPRRFEGDPARTASALAAAESHPEWLVRRWLARRGYDDTLAALRFNNARAPLTLRTDRRRISRDDLLTRLAEAGIDALPCAYAPDGVVVAPNARLDTVASLDGLYAIQDEGSQLVALATGVTSGQRVLDACASPGGKALILVAAAAPGLVVAGDLRPKRVALLARTVREAGAAAAVVRHDAERALPFGAVFDCVLVDAPCSGLGTLRRDPDLKWSRREADLTELAARQIRLLTQAARAVRRGGRLVYATCSTEPEENEAVVDAFLEGHPACRRGALPASFPSGPSGASLANARGELATSQRHGLEGFFAAVLVRQA